MCRGGAPLRACDFFDLFVFSARLTGCFHPHKTAILRACDFFALAREGLLSPERVVVDGKSSPSPNYYLSLGNNPLPFSHPLLSVIPSVPGFPAPPLSPATPDVVLFKENHTQQTEAAILDRKIRGSRADLRCAIRVPHISRSTTTFLCHPAAGHSGAFVVRMRKSLTD